METEIVFSGLCQFLNVHDRDKDIVEPSVILVQTDYCGAADCETHEDDDDDAYSNGNGKGNGKGFGGRMARRSGMPSNEDLNKEADKAGVPNGNGHVHKNHQHIPYIAFNTEEVKVDNATGFLPVPGAPNFRFMSLDGVEIRFEGGETYPLKIDSSYDEHVVQKDKYWPDAAKRYNERYVPKRHGKPDKYYVKAFLCFPGGELRAGKLARCAWAFLDGDDVTLCGRFAEEVLYRDFPHLEKKVVINLHDLQPPHEHIRTLAFESQTKGGKVTLYVGNHVLEDLATVMRREPFELFDPAVAGSHWLFLNQAAGLPGPGPLPKPLRIFPIPPGAGGGGLANVPCGPGG